MVCIQNILIIRSVSDSETEPKWFVFETSWYALGGRIRHFAKVNVNKVNILCHCPAVLHCQTMRVVQRSHQVTRMSMATMKLIHYYCYYLLKPPLPENKMQYNIQIVHL